jgi:excisionase family DNA binding protein
MSFLASLNDEARAELEALIDARADERVALAAREPQKRWLSAAEAAAYLGTSPRAIYQRISRGRIPETAIRRQGRSLLIDRLALDRALEDS